MITELKLNRLAVLKEALAKVQEEKTLEIRGATPQHYLDRIAEIEGDYQIKLDGLAAEIRNLEKQIKDEVIAKGETVNGNYLQAKYSKPRITWDGKGLIGYATANPEINRFKKVGKPSVSIVKIKRKAE